MRKKFGIRKELWQSLIVADIFLTLFLFWIVYSRLAYLTQLLQYKLPLVTPELTSHTTIVANPLTGSFILVGLPMIWLALIMSLIVFIIAYAFFSFL